MAQRMEFFGGPSVWLEFTPLARLTSSINLGQGSPGWGSPPFLKDALAKASIDDAYSQYAPSSGAPALKSAIAHFYAPRLTPVDNPDAPRLDASSQVIVTNGASQAISLACTALLGDGDEAILIEPAFDCYKGAVRLAGASPVSVPLLPAHHHHPPKSSADLSLDMQAFSKALSTRTKLVFINSPHNPTGKVFSRQEFMAIAEAIRTHAPQAAILSDEVYEHLIFDQSHHLPFAAVSPDAASRTISVYSAGKTFSATGIKVGWAIGPPSYIKLMQLAQQFIVFSVNHQGQLAVADALTQASKPFNGHPSYFAHLKDFYERKRDELVTALKKARLHPIVPQGAFYVCAHVPPSHPSRKQACLPARVEQFLKDGVLEIDEATRDLLDYNVARYIALHAKVVCIPVSAFFVKENRGKSFLSKDVVRFAFCHPDDVLKRAGQQLSLLR